MWSSIFLLWLTATGCHGILDKSKQEQMDAVEAVYFPVVVDSKSILNDSFLRDKFQSKSTIKPKPAVVSIGEYLSKVAVYPDTPSSTPGPIASISYPDLSLHKKYKVYTGFLPNRPSHEQTEDGIGHQNPADLEWSFIGDVMDLSNPVKPSLYSKDDYRNQIGTQPLKSRFKTGYDNDNTEPMKAHRTELDTIRTSHNEETLYDQYQYRPKPSSNTRFSPKDDNNPQHFQPMSFLPTPGPRYSTSRYSDHGRHGNCDDEYRHQSLTTGKPNDDTYLKYQPTTLKYPNDYVTVPRYIPEVTERYSDFQVTTAQYRDKSNGNGPESIDKPQYYIGAKSTTSKYPTDYLQKPLKYPQDYSPTTIRYPENGPLDYKPLYDGDFKPLYNEDLKRAKDISPYPQDYPIKTDVKPKVNNYNPQYPTTTLRYPEEDYIVKTDYKPHNEKLPPLKYPDDYLAQSDYNPPPGYNDPAPLKYPDDYIPKSPHKPQLGYYDGSTTLKYPEDYLPKTNYKPPNNYGISTTLKYPEDYLQKTDYKPQYHYNLPTTSKYPEDYLPKNKPNYYIESTSLKYPQDYLTKTEYKPQLVSTTLKYPVDYLPKTGYKPELNYGVSTTLKYPEDYLSKTSYKPHSISTSLKYPQDYLIRADEKPQIISTTLKYPEDYLLKSDYKLPANYKEITPISTYKPDIFNNYVSSKTPTTSYPPDGSKVELLPVTTPKPVYKATTPKYSQDYLKPHYDIPTTEYPLIQSVPISGKEKEQYETQTIRYGSGAYKPFHGKTLTDGHSMYVPEEYDDDYSAIPGRPGLDYPIFDVPPYTDFNCNDQRFPGYYADVDARCQVFHICQADGRANAFLCPNGTLFNQQYFVCDWWYNVHCENAIHLYVLNAYLYRDTYRKSY